MERIIILLISTLILFVAPDVKAQQFNFTNTTCGTSKVCIMVPDNCDPEANSTCLFGSLSVTSQNPPRGFNLYNELSGMSSGYIALELKPSGGNSTLFICGRNDTNNNTFFTTMSRSSGVNSTLTQLSMTTTSLFGNTTGNKIHCVFNVTNLNATATTRSTQDTTFTIGIGSGTVTNGIIGAYIQSKSIGPLDLANPANITATTTANTTANTTATPATTMSAATSVMPYHAALILLGILGMSVLGMA